MPSNRFTKHDLERKGFKRMPDGSYKRFDQPEPKPVKSEPEYIIRPDRLVLPITPMGKPRMTQQDKWRTDPYHPNPKKRQRKVVTKYWEFKKELVALFEKHNLRIPPIINGMHFIVPMPKSWTKRKKEAMRGKPHQQKPDTDNFVKAVKDCLCKDDSYVYGYDDIRKFWGDEGAIVVFPNRWVSCIE